MIRGKFQALAIAAGLFVSVGAGVVIAQEGEHGGMDKMPDKMGKMPGKKMCCSGMSDDQMMATMDKMSASDKAGMVDKMAAKPRATAMNMSDEEVNKLSVQEKADMFDKMPMATKKAMMSSDSQKGAKPGSKAKMKMKM